MSRTGDPVSLSANPHQIVQAVSTVLKGQGDAIELAVIALLAEGHLLIEDIPGVGKTTLARALAQAVDASVSRIQFTPDLLPSDIVGVSVFRPQTGAFEFNPGPVFASVVIADEINRASPKTQSALLESMQEAHVSVDGVTYRLPSPFMVIATQNPHEMEGTYPLPEAQRDRFMIRMSLGYPGYADEVTMLDTQELSDPLDAVTPVVTADQVVQMIGVVRSLYAAEEVKRYIVDLARATREMTGVRLGVSPRAGIQLLRAAKGAAALAGRRFVLPDDVQRMVPHVWGHRMSLGRTVSEEAVQGVLKQILERVKVR
ncbi:MAG: MoxR family ATPase [Propionibacteriaceae bacterium]|nr:MoxR family ATPase [Propionibacteriaceae bacterium]